MNGGAAPRGKATVALVLCRSCVEYVFEGTVTCPHCGRPAEEVGALYRDRGHGLVEAIRVIEAWRARNPPTQEAANTTESTT